MEKGYLLLINDDLTIDQGKETWIEKENGKYTKQTKFLGITIRKKINVLEVLKFLSVGVHEVTFEDGTKIKIDEEE